MKEGSRPVHGGEGGSRLIPLRFYPQIVVSSLNQGLFSQEKSTGVLPHELASTVCALGQQP